MFFLVVFSIIVKLTFQLTNYKTHYVTALKILIAIYAFALMFHILPGFSNYQILNKVYISPNAIPYSMYLNYNSLFVGVILIILNHNIKNTLGDNIKLSIIFGVIFGVISAIILGIIAFSFGFVEWDFKLTQITLIFLIQNLIFTCFYEEVFWRGYIQNSLNLYVNPSISIIITALLFGSIHIIFAGLNFAILAFIAGIAYGACYAVSKRIESSILCHYLVNVFQFIFVTYPILETAFK